MRSGVASIAIGAALLLGPRPVATAPPSGAGPAPQSTQENAPESTFSIFGLVESPGRYDWSAASPSAGPQRRPAGTPTAAPAEPQIQRMVKVKGRLVSRAVTEDDPWVCGM